MILIYKVIDRIIIISNEAIWTYVLQTIIDIMLRAYFRGILLQRYHSY
jgi:hypothetical protein